jgi:Icc protein
MSPLRIAQITDTHIVLEGSKWHGVDTTERLNQVVQHINTLKPDLVVHTGDLTEDGDIPSYQRAFSLLNQLKMPYYLTPGNHDNFHNLRSIFTDQPFQNDPFGHYVIEQKGIKLIIMDSTIQGEVFGTLCSHRKQWLETELQKGSLPTLIFMHHFPIEVAESLFNKFRLLNGEELERLLKSYPHVKGVYCGHYHHATASNFSNAICWISPSTAPTHIVEGDRCLGINLTQPAYSLHTITGEKVISKIIPVTDTGPL